MEFAKMKTLVIYNSQTGFTKRYAEWIAEAANANCLEFSEAKKKSTDEYDVIVFGGWAVAGGISKLSWFKKNMSKWEGKKLIAFCVGASPIENPEIEPTLKKNFTEDELKKVDIFYCPGGFDYDKMSAPSKMAMKMFIKALKAQKNKTEKDEVMIKMISSSYDISDRKYIEPIVDCINSFSK